MRTKFLYRLASVVLTVAVAALTLQRLDLSDNSLLSGIEQVWTDTKFRLRGSQAPGTEIVIVGLDDKTLAKLSSGRTFSRKNWALLVDRLAALQPKVIGIDAFFPDQDSSDPLNDKAFAAAIERAGNVALGTLVKLEAADDVDAVALPHMTPEVIARQGFPTEYARGGSRSASLETRVVRGHELILNLPELTEAASAFGFLNVLSDGQGRIRRLPLFVDYERKLYPSLAVQLVRRYLDAPSPEVALNQKYVWSVKLANRAIPVDQFGILNLNFSGPAGARTTVSMIDVIEGSVAANVVRGKIVLVGAVAASLSDVVATPFSAAVPGVELQADAIDNILHDRYVYRTLLMQITDLALVLLLGVLIPVVMPRLSPPLALVFSVLLAAALVAVNIWAFLSQGALLGLVYPGLAFILQTGIQFVSRTVSPNTGSRSPA